VLSSDLDEIDTTPTLDERPAAEPVRRIEVPLDEFGEIDTTPQPDRPKETAPSPASEPATQRTAEEADDPNRPKRSGWWQRRSFF
jgi:ribonuclease E